jgi:hypothetical protein
MKVIAHLPIEESLKQSLRISEGRAVKVNGRRYSVANLKSFAMHGCKCVRCGREANRLLAWEDNGGGMHVDLFHRNGSGKLILMNRDHIIPKSKKGPNTEWNYQTMCIKCNCKKGNVETDADRKLAEFRAKWKKVHMFIHANYWKVLPAFARKGAIGKLVIRFRERHVHKLSYLFAKVLA